MREFSFHLTMTIVALAVGLFSVYGLLAYQIAVPFVQLLPRGALLLLLLGGVAFYRWRQEAKICNLLLMAFWTLLLSNLHLFPMFIAARQGVELSDEALARVDAALGLEVPAMLSWVQAYPAVGHVLDMAYATLRPLMVLAILIPPLCGRMDRAKEYAISNIAAALMGISLFAVFQAIGPWRYYSFPPSASQDEYERVFSALRHEGWFRMDLSYGHGLISFPSFHTILAVLAAFALRSTPYVRWPAGVLALLIVVATVTSGWHYVVDVVAGLLVAIAAIAVARMYLWLEQRSKFNPNRQPAPVASLLEPTAVDYPNPGPAISPSPPRAFCSRM